MNAILNIQDTLSLARLVAGYAESLGVKAISGEDCHFPSHLGAVMADAVLQAGLNYRTVVKTRVERILTRFPSAATLSGTLEFVRGGNVSDFLLWNHFQKIERFVELAHVMERYEIENTSILSSWLQTKDARVALLQVSGIGPKTVDYLACLVGLDFVAVDRHIRAFTRESGIFLEDYQSIKTVVSYAADLLDISRRDFDAWVWNFMSTRAKLGPQFYLL